MAVFSRLLVGFVILVSLIGCGATSATSIAAQTTQTTSEMEGVESLPTTTPRPSFTPLPSKTPNLTQTVTHRDNATAQSAEQTVVAQYPRVCKTLFAPREFSPNESWMVEFCNSENDQSPILTLSNKETQDLWKLVYRDYIQQGENLPDGGLSIVYWSSDNRYAYFNSYISGSGGDCFVSGNVLNYGKGLFRLNLDTGDTVAILPLRDNSTGYDFSFSPTGRRLVYEAYLLGVNILDIQTGKLVKIIPVGEFNGGGSYLWSSDGLEFAYSTVLYNEISEPISYSLRLVDAQTGSERILLESPDTCFAARSWSANNILTIENYDKNYDRTLIEYDLSANKVISEATETPRP